MLIKNEADMQPRLRPSQVCLAVALVLAGQQALAQQLPEEEDAQLLDEVTVTATTEQETPEVIGNTASAEQELIERRGATHLSDVVNQISGTNMNSLYFQPEVSVGVQGVAGHGRVSQQLESITQNFHIFTRDIGMTGSIIIDPQFLKSIDVSRGANSSTSSLGSLGGTVDFRYLDVDDIVQPGKSYGGMLRASTGVGKYKNGQKPSGSFFLGGRTERWEVMLGAADAENDDYRVGSKMDMDDMLNNAAVGGSRMTFYKDNRPFYEERDKCRYTSIVGIIYGQDGMSNCMIDSQRLQWLSQAADSGPLLGTGKNPTRKCCACGIISTMPTIKAWNCLPRQPMPATSPIGYRVYWSQMMAVLPSGVHTHGPSRHKWKTR